MDRLTRLGAAAGAALKERGQTVAVCESSGGGLIAAALLAMPGASAYFKGGVVSYTADSRRVFLRPPADAFSGVKPGTGEHALVLARLARDALGATWGLAESGAAGPTGSRYGYAAGHSCIGVAGPVERAREIETAHSEREANMWSFARSALELLEQCVKAQG